MAFTPGIDIIQTNDKEIIIVDYSSCKEIKMIELVISLGSLIKLRNKPTLLLAIYDERSFLTSKYMRQAEQTTSEIIHLIDKIAFVGLSTPRQMILKGYNFLFNKNFQYFDTKEDALNHLVNDIKKCN
jgi:hypothetical protein